jgi:hypothetical protein
MPPNMRPEMPWAETLTATLADSKIHKESAPLLSRAQHFAPVLPHFMKRLDRKLTALATDFHSPQDFIISEAKDADDLLAS